MPGSAQAQSDRTPGSAPLKFWEITPDQWRRFVAVRTTAPLALGERRLARDDDRRPSQGDRGFESVSLQPSSGESIANRTAARGIFPKSCLAPVEAAAPDRKSSGSAACSNIAPQNARSHAQGLARAWRARSRSHPLTARQTVLPDLSAERRIPDRSRLEYPRLSHHRRNGEDLAGLPLSERKARLATVMDRGSPPLQYSDHQVGCGPVFYAEACKLGLEGIVSKRADAPYVPGKRGQWGKTNNNTSNPGPARQSNCAAQPHCRDTVQVTLLAPVTHGVSSLLCGD
jgi:hypothetical protein